jgi:hypothetical protein
MINRGHCSKCGSVSRGRAGSAEDGLSVRPAKRLRFKNLRCGAHLPLLLLLAVSCATAGCAVTGTKADQSLTPTISVSLMQGPPSPMSVGATATVSATVSNDVANAGVDWVAMCNSVPACGGFSPAHTASGSASTFTAPVGVPPGKTVTVTALSTTDHGKTSAATVTIVPTVTGVTITQLPPPAFPSGGNVNVAATVAGDPGNLGVDWTATCGADNCTSGFIGHHSDPGVPVTFIVPLVSTMPAIVGSTVTLTAVATADHNFSASTTFTATTPISISITQPPPNTLLPNTTVPVSAVVTNDPTNSGVTWTIASCDIPPCGSWSGSFVVQKTQVASGATATYYAPPAPVNHVILQAAATAGLINAVATVAISIQAPISITLTQGVPNNAIVVKISAPLVATVMNDAANAGVDWKVTCASTGAGACGSFSPTHTASGGTATYTAPTAVPMNNTVTITATSSSDPTKSVSETVTINATALSDSLLTGTWIMLLSGRDANGGPFSLGGAIVGNGIGQITSANLDLGDIGGGPGLYNAASVGLASTPASTYVIGNDGRGQIQLKLNTGSLNGNFGVNNTGSIVLSVVFVTSKHALLSESDAFGSGTGTLDLQNAADLAAFQKGTSGLNGLYSVGLAGADLTASNARYFLEAALSFQPSGSSYAETSYIADQLDKGAVTSIPVHAASHTFSNPAPSAYGELALDSVNFGLPTQYSLDAWLIDAKHFVITDFRDLFSTPAVLISGYMVAEPSPQTGLFGTYAFTVAGETTAPALIPQAVGGIFACAATGTLDVVPLGGTASNTPITGVACSTPANGHGRGLITFSGTTGISRFATYPTVDQGLFLIELDSAGTSGPSGAGVARSRTLSGNIPPSAFNGMYASNFLANTSQGLEAFAGQIGSNGVSALTGTADVNSFNASTPPLGVGTPSSNAALSGSFTAATDGRFPLVLMIKPAVGQPAPQFSTISPACYIVDPNTCLLLGLDITAPGTGILELQNTGL